MSLSKEKLNKDLKPLKLSYFFVENKFGYNKCGFNLHPNND